MGIDAATLARAMEPFFTARGLGKGTGHRPAMVHGRTEQSGGRLILESQLGQGTTAALWLPAGAKGPDASIDADTPGITTASRPLIALAVDDDSPVLMNTVALLVDLGHTVFEARSGEEALTIVRRERGIDFVIIDQAMPNMTGVQFAESRWPSGQACRSS